MPSILSRGLIARARGNIYGGRDFILNAQWSPAFAGIRAIPFKNAPAGGFPVVARAELLTLN